MVKKLLAISVISLLPFVFLQADDTKKPAMQIEDNTFFDPTRKIAAEAYHFGVEYRLEVGYTQHYQRVHRLTYPGLYLDGGYVGATFTFLLPIHFSLQTGLIYNVAYGEMEQHWRSISQQNTQKEYIRHHITEHQLMIPVKMYYTVPLWKQLNLFFFTGMQLHIGLADQDKITTHLSDDTRTLIESWGIRTKSYDRMADERWRANVQWTLGGGLEWDRYRFQASYDFGLNNLVRHPGITKRYMSEWGWQIGLAFRL
jgi:outer membrane receptor protein involved in Fe transport